MTIHPLPPQAYTKDTLIKAYEWLQAQGDSIKQIATSPDVLVSLYMKAQMQGEEALHRPSIKNFKSDLKNLASMMGEWEAEQEVPMTRVSSPRDAGPSMGAMHSSGPSTSVVQATHTETRVSNSVSITTEVPVLNEDLRDKVREIQEQYHLSNETEALKLLISIGYHHAKRLMS